MATKGGVIGPSATPVAASPCAGLSVPDLSAAFPSRFPSPLQPADPICASGLPHPQGESAKAQRSCDPSVSPSGAASHELLASTPCLSRRPAAASVSQEPSATIVQGNVPGAKGAGEHYPPDPAVVAGSDEMRVDEPPTDRAGGDHVQRIHAGQCSGPDLRSPQSASLPFLGQMIETPVVLPTEHPQQSAPSGLEARTNGPDHVVAASSKSTGSGSCDATTPRGPALKVLSAPAQRLWSMNVGRQTEVDFRPCFGGLPKRYSRCMHRHIFGVHMVI